MASVSKQPTGPFNPFAGCAILLILLFGIISAIGLVWISGTGQNEAIAKFTVDAPVKLVSQRVEAPLLDALKQRIGKFAEDVKAGREVKLSLSVPELNELIALAPEAAGRFDEILAFKAARAPDTLVADVCLPMNKLKFWEGKRYAVGEAVFGVEIIEKRGPEMHMKALTVPGKEVSAEFTDRLAKFEWLTMYQSTPELAAILRCITGIAVSAGGVELAVAAHDPLPAIAPAPSPAPGPASRFIMPVMVFVITLLALKMFRRPAGPPA